MTIRVLIGDAQPVVCDGLAMLPGLIDDVETVATAADGIEAVERARSALPDISCSWTFACRASREPRRPAKSSPRSPTRACWS